VDWNNILQALQSALVDILLALIGLGSVYAVFYINKLKSKIQVEIEKTEDEKQRKLFEDALNRTNDLVVKTVMGIEQTTASSLRESVKDGKVDRAELLALGKTAVETVYNQLSTDTILVLQNQITDVKQYITDSVEANVLKLKDELGIK
jgi:hypothetical protein